MRVAKRAVVALLIAFALFHIMGCVSGASIQRSTREFPQGTGFITRTVVVDQKERKFAVFVPRDYLAGKKYPTIVFRSRQIEVRTRDGSGALAVYQHFSADDGVVARGEQ